MTSNRLRALGVARRTEHSNEALRLFAGEGGELLETDGGIDVVAQQDLSSVGVAGEQTFYAFGQQAFPKVRVA